MLHTHFEEFELARKHYKTALDLSPEKFRIHYDFANLLQYQIKEYTLAKKHYDR
eukprot:UN04691